MMKSQNSILKIPQKAKRKKAEVVKTEVQLKNENSKKEKEFIRPTLEETITFFKEENHSELEAKKFFNHFESNGWKVGGKTPMKNWQAAACNFAFRSGYKTIQSTPTAKTTTNPYDRLFSLIGLPGAAVNKAFLLRLGAVQAKAITGVSLVSQALFFGSF
ncbi:MAG: hypothetical protein Q8928_08780 [Bacteroidota bacterium]|nr:hypothetical protein [Bacteroidota bacterium]